MNNIFENRIKVGNKTRVPVWFMRQAGRYHGHYQNIKKDSSFMQMCKNPQLAMEVTMGPINEFDFDAAILFSDLLFPLEHMGLGLEYNPGPQLKHHLKTDADFKNIKISNSAEHFYGFQKDACKLLKEKLPNTKTLLGFVGAPFTLFAYAVEGSHSGALTSSKTGLYDGRFEKFTQYLLPNLMTEMTLQAEGGADAICLFDTAVGELTLKDFQYYAAPKIKWLTSEFKRKFPMKKIIYYSRNTTLEYLHVLDDKNIDVLGVDWRINLANALNELGDRYYIQGNFDPCWLHLPWNQVQKNLEHFYEQLISKKCNLNKWICGLGHGVLQHTPEINVKKSVEFIHQNFLY